MKIYDTLNPTGDDERSQTLEPGLYILEHEFVNADGSQWSESDLVAGELSPEERALDLVNYPFRGVMGQEEYFDAPMQTIRDLNDTTDSFLKVQSQFVSTGPAPNVDYNDYVYLRVDVHQNIQFYFSQLVRSVRLASDVGLRVRIHTCDMSALAPNYPTRVKLLEHPLGNFYDVNRANRPFELLFLANTAVTDEFVTTYLKDNGQVDRREKHSPEKLYGILDHRINERPSCFPLFLDWANISKIEPTILTEIDGGVDPNIPRTLDLIEVTY